LSRETHSRGGQDGFTMIEVVVALAVVAFVLAGIGSLFAAAANGSRVLEQHVALVETTRLVATMVPRRPEFQTDGAGELSGHRWQVRVSPFFGAGQEPPASPWMLQSVVIRVQSPSGAVMSVETARLQKKDAP
jgi:general secretion pathway protein I